MRQEIWRGYLDDSGHVVVPDPQHALVGKAAVYARVSTHKQRDDLDRQAQRMTEFAKCGGVVGGGCYQGSRFRGQRHPPEADGLVEGGFVGHVGG